MFIAYFSSFIELGDEPNVINISPALYKVMAKVPFHFDIDQNGKPEFYDFKFNELLHYAEEF